MSMDKGRRIVLEETGTALPITVPTAGRAVLEPASPDAGAEVPEQEEVSGTERRLPGRRALLGGLAHESRGRFFRTNLDLAGSLASCLHNSCGLFAK
jgi:hypothetical protein